MRCRVKQTMKRVTALGMAVWMALMPMSGRMPKVYGSQTGTSSKGVVRIAFDSYVSPNISVTEVGGTNAEKGESDGDSKAMLYTSLQQGKEYTLSVNYIPDLEVYKDYIEIVDEIGVMSTDKKFIVSEGMLSNDLSDVDISLKVCLKSDILFSISGTDCENINATVGDTVLEKDQSGNYILKSGTCLTDSVVVTFQTGIDRTVNDVRVKYLGITESKRNFRLTASVKDILESKAITILAPEVKKYNVTAVNGKIEITPSYEAASSNQYYEPIEDEKVKIIIAPNDGYKITKIELKGFETDGSDTILNENDIKNNKYEVVVSQKKKGDIIVTMTVIGPNGTFNIADYYGTNGADVMYTKPTNMKTGYVLQYAIAEGPDISASKLTWNNFPSEVDSQYKLTVPYVQGELSKYIYVRYSDASGSFSEPQVSKEIRFDDLPPQIKKVQLFLNGKSYVATFNPGDASQLIDPYYYFDYNDIYIGEKEGACNEIRVYAKDDPEINNSGLQQELTAGAEKGMLSNDGTYYEISYGIENKTDMMAISLSDQAENFLNTQIKLDNIGFDLTPPKADIEFSREGSAVDIEKWQIDAVTVTVNPIDPAPSVHPDFEVSSGIKSVTIFDNGEKIGRMDSNTKVCTATISGDGVHNLEIVVTDNAGNESSESKTIRIDKEGIRNERINFESGNDKNYDNCIISAGADSRSGIQKIRFEFVEQGVVVREYTTTSVDHGAANFLYTRDMGTFNGIVRVTFMDVAGRTKETQRAFAFNENGALITMSADSGWTNGNVFVTVTASDSITDIDMVEYYVDGVLAERAQPQTRTSYTGGITISDTAVSQLGTQVEVVVTSASGKKTHGYAVVRIDRQSPSISLSGATEGSVYNTTRSLQITTVENIWQEMQPVTVTAVRTIDGSSSHMDLGAFEADGETTTATYTFSEDGIYQVTVQAVDAAGNSDTKTISFTVDRTAPVLSMTGVSAGAYSNTPVTVHFQSVESFFETNSVRINVERKLAGSTFGRSIDFSSTGKTSNVSNIFAEDGDYTITFSATDGAGNIAAVQTLSFTVDCTAPLITLRGTTDYFVTKDAVKLDFSVTEAYYETNIVQIQGTRRTVEGKTLPLTLNGWSNTGMTSALSREFTEDGYYTITITATDKAGNSKSQTIHFTIDTTPPVIGDLSEYDGKYLAGFQLKEKLKNLILELSVPTVRMTLNGEPYDGSEITGDGKYTLMIQVEDEVGLTASRTIEFVIDTVAPKIIFAGAENNRIYTAAVNLNLSLENEKDTILAIQINGKPYELTEGAAVYDLVFNEQGYYVIVVDTIDAAGNTNSQSIAFTYAEEKSIVLLFVIIGAVVPAAGLVIGMTVKSKRKGGGA